MQARTYKSIFILLCLWLPTVSFAQRKNMSSIHFTRLSTQDGLSQSTINAIAKDKIGYMWFGTNDGLNRYDGYRFKIYRNLPDDSTSLPYNHIKTLLVDRKGSLWAGTLGGGLVRYNEKKDAFDRYNIGLIQRIFEDRQHRIWVGTFDGLYIINPTTYQAVRAEIFSQTLTALRGKNITAIAEDRNNNLWVGTMNGLFKIEPDFSKVTPYFSTYKKTKSAIAEIADIIIDRDGILWVGSKEGLYTYDPTHANFSAAQFSENKKNKPLKSVINSLTCDSEHTIWIGTDDGLGRYQSELKHFDVSKNDVHDVQSLSRNSVNTVYTDDNAVWVGTALGGISKYDKTISFFNHYNIFHERNQKANTNVVTSFSEDNLGDIYIGTDGGGLFLWNSILNTFKPLLPEFTDDKATGKSILSLCKSRNGDKLWIGTYADGLFELDLRNNKLKRLYISSETALSNTIYAIIEDKKSNIWIGTNGGGVHVINPKGQVVSTLTREKTGTLTNNYIRSLMEDRHGHIWIGSYGGINIYNPSNNKFVPLSDEARQLKRHLTTALLEDSRKRVWIGTYGAGLFIYDSVKKNVLDITEANGLSNNNVNNIMHDKRGFVWVSTSKGLNKLSEEFTSTEASIINDILPSTEFTLGAGYMRQNGDMLFGSTNGFNLFTPASAKKNRTIPPVVITDFQLSARSPNLDFTSPQSAALQRGKISLDYTQSVFTIEFAALNYIFPEKNKYAYMLTGIDKDWQYTADQRRVTYNNLKPGNYVFQVKAINHDGVWNDEGTSLQIFIHPPFWKTSWAYLFYLIVVSTIIYYIVKELRKRKNLENELLIQKVYSEKTEELNQLKMSFFTNVSHELRTPLTLIIDPIRKISNDEVATSQIKSLSTLAYKNASNMLTLVNQLLDFRKFQGKNIAITTSVNIEDLVREIVLVFGDQAMRRKLTVDLLFDLEFSTVDIDPDKFQKILTNLLANAFKFTPDGGNITLITSTLLTNKDQKRILEIRLADSGPGIPTSYKNKIFQMFFQIKGVPHFESHSSGIGLALVKELVELHGGTISEEGQEGNGALFVIQIPLVKSWESVSESQPQAEKTSVIISETLESKSEIKHSRFDKDTTILIVEDNTELRAYIAAQLSDYYHVEQAENGEKGYDQAIASIPNIIVSDVMMDGGNGLDLCENIKNNEKTSHIPVILLTAKHADEGKIRGYRSGADAYISKPFNSDLLLSRIDNLLKSRRRLTELYKKPTANDISPQQYVSKIDKEFLQKAATIIYDNLLESSFDVAAFATLLDMNRRQLTRKLKALIEQTPQEFIIHIRLKTAIKLIIEQDMNISQAAFNVGFAEPSNFSRSFSKVYGKSPKNYIKSHYGKSAL